MQIEHIEVINLFYSYPQGQGFIGTSGPCTARVTTLVRLHTDQGQTGVGSAYTHPALACLIIQDHLAPMLQGEDPRHIPELWEKMYGLTRWYGRKGAAMSALGAIDIALWDLHGKLVGQPVWALCGGAHSSCPAYASGLLWNEPDRLQQEAERHLANGFRRMKMRLGRSERYDIAAVETVRSAIGPDHDLIVDASMRYSLPVARRMARVLQENQVFWFEEPFVPEEIQQYKLLRDSVDIPVAAGENEFGVQGFDELIRCGAVDIVQADASRCGGITELRRIAQHAAEAQLKIAPHSWSDAIAVVANAHVAASLEHALTVEIDQTGNDLVDRLLVTPLRVQDGQLQLSDAPGLGIELDEEVLQQLKTSRPLQVPQGHYSDMIFGQQFYHPVGEFEPME